jgi:hypothetical protein
MDILSFALGMNAAKGSGGSSGGGMAFRTLKYGETLKLTGTWNESVSIDFGFVPDFLCVYPKDTVSTGSSNFMFMGFSTKAYEAMYSFKQKCFYMSSGILKEQRVDYTCIDETGTDAANNAPLNSVTANGFKFGKSHAAGNYDFFALKLF